jgi:uncharacterized protein YndB with AHSA1/START domain
VDSADRPGADQEVHVRFTRRHRLAAGQPGSRIVWKGTYEGKPYEDKGEIVEIEPFHRMKVTHFSPMSGQEDVPENYHTLTYELEQRGGKTHVSLSQDNNASEEEAKHSRSNWETMLTSLKQVVEGG